MTKQEFIDKYQLENVNYGLGYDFSSSDVMSIVANKLREYDDAKLNTIINMLEDWIKIIDKN